MRLLAAEVGNRVKGWLCRYRIVDTECVNTVSELKFIFNVTDCYMLNSIMICMENCAFLRQASADRNM